MEEAWLEYAVMFTSVWKSTFLLYGMILYKDVIHSHVFHLKGSSKGVASSSGRWEVLLIKHSLWRNILLVSVGYRKFSLLLKALCSQ